MLPIGLHVSKFGCDHLGSAVRSAHPIGYAEFYLTVQYLYRLAFTAPPLDRVASVG